MNIEDFLQNPIMVKICFSLLNNKNPAIITQLYRDNAKHIGSYSSYSKKTNWLESLGIVSTERIGRVKKVSLTPKGKRFSILLRRADEVLQSNEIA